MGMEAAATVSSQHLVSYRMQTTSNLYAADEFLSR